MTVADGLFKAGMVLRFADGEQMTADGIDKPRQIEEGLTPKRPI
jgi:hypothetical protein